MTYSTTQIVDALHEALNGLSIGWQLANVRDDEKRNHLQAPINAGTAAILALLDDFEGKPMAGYPHGPSVTKRG